MRGTRPFWVFAATLGMGLGIVAYAVAELWWVRPESPGEGSRLRWRHGLLVTALGGLVVSALRAVIA